MQLEDLEAIYSLALSNNISLYVRISYSLVVFVVKVDSGGGGSAEVMVYSLGWGMGEPERRGADRKRSQPAPVSVVHTPLSPDEGHEVDVLPLHNQVYTQSYKEILRKRYLERGT